MRGLDGRWEWEGLSAEERRAVIGRWVELTAEEMGMGIGRAERRSDGKRCGLVDGGGRALRGEESGDWLVGEAGCYGYGRTDWLRETSLGKKAERIGGGAESGL